MTAVHRTSFEDAVRQVESMRAVRSAVLAIRVSSAIVSDQNIESPVLDLAVRAVIAVSLFYVAKAPGLEDRGAHEIACQIQRFYAHSALQEAQDFAWASIKYPGRLQGLWWTLTVLPRSIVNDAAAVALRSIAEIYARWLLPPRLCKSRNPEVSPGQAREVWRRTLCDLSLARGKRSVPQ